MPPQAHEITRAELLAALKRDRIKPAQLHRWHDAGIFPDARREGRGRPRRGARGETRGGGSVAYYPRLAVLQARTIAHVLKTRPRRTLGDAGWATWVLGFPQPDAEWVRDLLLAEVRAGLRVSAREYRRYQRGDARSVLARAGRRRPLVGTEAMRSVVPPESLPGVFQMMLEVRLGLLGGRQYGEPEWLKFQDAGLALVAPELLHEPDVPSWEEVRAGMTRLSGEINDRAVIRALKGLEPAWLRALTNEAQLLFELGAESLGLSPDLVMSRDYFLRYFKARRLDSKASRELVNSLKQLGWTRPPRSPLRRAFDQLAQQAGEPASSTSPQRTP
jgi:hypothetical protein